MPSRPCFRLAFESLMGSLKVGGEPQRSLGLLSSLRSRCRRYVERLADVVGR